MTTQSQGLLFDANGNLMVSGLASAQPRSKQIAAVLSHSYGLNTIPKAPILSASAAAGVVTIATQANLNLAANEMVYVYGMTSQLGLQNWDGYFQLTAANNSGPFQYTFNNPLLGTVPSFNLPNGQVYLYIADAAIGIGGIGYNPQSGVVWAKVLSYDGFWLPPSYVYGATGGGILPLFSSDPGVVTLATYIAARSPRAGLIFTDLGINDANSGSNFANCQAAMISAASIMRSSGGVPVMLCIRPSALSLSANKWAKQWNRWLWNYANVGGWITIDTTKLLVDPTSNIGAGLAAMYADNVHLNDVGGLMDGHDIANKISNPAIGSGFTGSSGPIILNGNDEINSAADQYDSALNPTGTIAPLTGGIPVGVFSGTVGAVAIAGTQTVVGQGLSALNFGAGTSAPTIGISPRTDTTPDGTIIPASEAVCTFGNGTGPKEMELFLNGSGGSILPGAGTYTAGDKLKLSMEYEIDPASITPGVVYVAPNLVLAEDASTGSRISVSSLGGAGNTLTGSQLVTKGVISTPVLLTRSNSTDIVPQIYVGISSGTLTTPLVIRIRSISLRKADPVYGEPF